MALENRLVFQPLCHNAQTPSCSFCLCHSMSNVILLCVSDPIGVETSRDRTTMSKSYRPMTASCCSQACGAGEYEYFLAMHSKICSSKRHVFLISFLNFMTVVIKSKTWWNRKIIIRNSCKISCADKSAQIVRGRQTDVRPAPRSVIIPQGNHFLQNNYLFGTSLTSKLQRTPDNFLAMLSKVLFSKNIVFVDFCRCLRNCIAEFEVSN